MSDFDIYMYIIPIVIWQQNPRPKLKQHKVINWILEINFLYLRDEH